MSILEMQLAAIKEISRLEDEKVLKEILDHLAQASLTQKQSALNLSQHYDKVKAKYGEVLQKLAQ